MMVPFCPPGKGCVPGFLCLDFDENMLAWKRPGILRSLVAMGVQGFLLFSLVMLVEYNIPQRLYLRATGGEATKTAPTQSASTPAGLDPTPEDSDVAQERQRINSTPISTLKQENSLLMVNLTKRYIFLTAVRDVCVGIPAQECFGLLGQNGAGKTTIFKMLTGLEMPSSGNAYLLGHDIRMSIKKVA